MDMRGRFLTAKKVLMPRSILVLIVFLLAPLSLLSQAHEMEDAIHKKVIDFAEISVDSVLLYAKQLQESKNVCRALTGHYYEANVLYKRYDYINCERKLNYILSQVETQKHSSSFQYSKLFVGQTFEEALDVLKISVYRRFFYMRLNQHRYSDAFDFLELLQTSIEPLRDKGSYYVRNIILSKLAEAALHRRVGNYEFSLQIINEAMHSIDTIGIEPDNQSYNYFLLERAHIFNDLARGYEFLLPEHPEYIDSVDYYTDKTYDATRRLDNRSRENDRSHFVRKSHVRLLRKDYEEALQIASKAMKLSTTEKDMPDVLLLQARCRVKLHQLDSAIYYGKAFLTYNAQGGLNKKDVLMAYNILAESFYLQERIDSAYTYSTKLQAELQAETYNKDDTQERLSEQRIKGFMALNKEINKKRNALRLQLFLTIIVATLLVLGVVILFLRKRRNYQKRIHILQEKYTRLQASVKPKNENKKEIDNDLLNRVLKELEKIEESTIFLDPDFTLSSLSKILKTNTNYLSKIINQYKGKSFSKYLVTLRINHLLSLLNQQPIRRRHSIKALGKAIGYSNASSFTRAFKNHMGITPSEYLKRTFPDEFR